MTSHKPLALLAFSGVLAASASAQVPDLMNAFDAGSRSLALGGGTGASDTSTYSAVDNPATLAFVRTPTWGFSLRNFPESATTASGNFVSRSTSTIGFRGKMGVSHIGYAFPLKDGAAAITYTVGGYLNNSTVGNGLTSNGLFVANLQENTRAQTDFITFGYGKSRGTRNVGASVIVAHQYTAASQSYTLVDANQNNAGTVSSSASGDSYGLGVVVGMQETDQLQGTTWGLSLRSPIRLSGNSNTADYYSIVPGKLAASFAGRMNGRDGSSNFLTWGTEAAFYYGGKQSTIISRKNYIAGGFGVEYNFVNGDYRLPVRLGYSYNPSGGDGFDDRNAFTFGLGYKPNDGAYSFDLTFARPSTGGPWDMALGLTFKPGK